MMLKYDYTYDDMKNTLLEAGLKQGDTVLMHSDLATLGISKEFAEGKNPAELIHDAIFEIIGENGTLVVPTFTYSFCKDEIYDPETSKSTVGYFGNWFRKQRGVVRSLDPIFSMASKGPNTKFLFDTGNASFDENSSFAKLEQIEGAKVLFLGNYSNFTAIHYAQRTMNIPIRYNKLFSGKIKLNGTLQDLDWIYYVRVNIPNTEGGEPYFEKILKTEGVDAMFEPDNKHYDDAARMFVKSGAMTLHKLGKSQIFAGIYKDLMTVCRMWIKRRDWYFAVGPMCELMGGDCQRTGYDNFDTEIDFTDKEAAITNILKIPRYTLGEGYDYVLDALKLQLDFLIHFYYSGYMVGDKPVPERWYCKKAEVTTSGGAVIMDMKSVIPYSKPQNMAISKEELLKHLHEDKEQMKVWGFFKPDKELTEDTYNVHIDSYFSYYWMRLGAYIVKGKTDECTLIAADITTNSREEWKNILNTMEIFRNMQPGENEQSYCLLFTPGKIGVDCYLQNEYHSVQIKKIINMLNGLRLFQ